MKNHIFRNYRFLFQTIWEASASRVFQNILFAVINSFFSIFYQVLFFAYFMGAVEKGKGITEIGKALMVFILINLIFEVLDSWYHQAYLPRNDVKLSLFLKNKIIKRLRRLISNVLTIPTT